MKVKVLTIEPKQYSQAEYKALKANDASAKIADFMAIEEKFRILLVCCSFQ